MKPSRNDRPLNALAAFVGLALCISSSQAQTLRHPVQSPVFTLELPAGWKARHDNQWVAFDLPTDSTYHASIRRITTITPSSNAQFMLGSALRKQADEWVAQGMTNASYGTLSVRMGDDGVLRARVRVEGKIRGVDSALIQQGFITPSNDAYVLRTDGPVATQALHAAEFESLLHSFAFVPAGNNEAIGQTQVAHARNAAAGIQAAISAYFASNGVMPAPGRFKDDRGGRFHASVTNDAKGMVTVTMADDLDVEAHIRGQQFTLTPLWRNAGPVALSGAWRCAASGGLDARFLPSTCRAA